MLSGLRAVAESGVENLGQLKLAIRVRARNARGLANFKRERGEVGAHNAEKAVTATAPTTRIWRIDPLRGNGEAMRIERRWSMVAPAVRKRHGRRASHLH